MSLRTFFIVSGMLSLIGLVMWGLGDALAPLMISFGLAYLVLPIVKKIEEKGIDRNKAVIGVFAIFLVIVIVGSALIIPILVDDAKSFSKEIPQITAGAVNKVEFISEKLGVEVDLSKDRIQKLVQSHVSTLSGSLVNGVATGMKSAFSGIANWLIAILNLFLIPLFFFYVINDFEKIWSEFRSLIPESTQPRIAHYMKLSNEVLSGYIRGQMMVALVLGALYAIGLAIVGLKFGLLIGVLSGLISIIPYAGFTLGFLTAILVGLANFSGVGMIIGIVIVFGVVQTLEGTIITPKFVGDKVGLSSLATMLALIIGGNMFGIVGMVAAIPLAAIGKSLFVDLKKEYHQLDFYKL